MMTEEITAPNLLNLAQSMCDHGSDLVAMSRDRIATSLCTTARGLADPALPEAHALRQALRLETGLSPELIEWGLDQLALSFEDRAMARLLMHCEGGVQLRMVPPRLSVVVLAGNVFTASLRAIALPLLAQSPVVVKAPKGGAALISTFIRLLQQVDEQLAQHLAMVTFGRNEESLSQALWTHAEVVSAYGDDNTMLALRRSLPVAVRLLEHGHGLSAAYIPRSALVDATQLKSVARRLALDVLSYDQLGCLSPQVAMVQAGGAVDHVGFAEALHHALGELALLLPRGQVPVAAAAHIAQWRGVAAAVGQLFQASEHACSVESGALRIGPGYRHIGVYSCDGVAGVAQRLLPFGHHLKALGVAGPAAVRTEVALGLPPGLSPRVCAVGTMQTPPLDAYFDGQPPFAGLLSQMQIA